jgi:uncharacterized protein (UPF0335 family)
MTCRIKMPRKTKPTETAVAGAGHNSFDDDRLRSLVERIESIESERAELASDLGDVYAAAKSAGFDAQALRHVIRMRKQDKTERAERQAVIDEYLAGARRLWHDRAGSRRHRARRRRLMPPV